MHKTIGLLLLLLAASVPAASAPIKTMTRVDRPIATELFVSVGDLMVRIEVRESLPNAFGGADIFGRTRDRGFSELRYIGVDAGFPVFRRRDVDIITNETTVNRPGTGSAVVNVPPPNSGLPITGIITRPHAPNIQALPPDTIEFGLDLSKSRVLTIRDRTVEIIEATGAGVRYRVLAGS